MGLEGFGWEELESQAKTIKGCSGGDERTGASGDQDTSMQESLERRLG